MKNKKIFLALIASVSLTPVVLIAAKRAQKENPSVMTKGLDTVLIPGAVSIVRFCVENHDIDSNRQQFKEMNNIPIFQINENGSLEKKMTLGQLRAEYKFQEKDFLLGVEGESTSLFEQWWDDIPAKISSNCAVRCPKAVLEYPNGGWWIFTSKERVEVPLVIVVGKNIRAYDACEVCEKIEEYYKLTYRIKCKKKQ